MHGVLILAGFLFGVAAGHVTEVEFEPKVRIDQPLTWALTLLVALFVPFVVRDQMETRSADVELIRSMCSKVEASYRSFYEAWLVQPLTRDECHLVLAKSRNCRTELEFLGKALSAMDRVGRDVDDAEVLLGKLRTAFTALKRVTTNGRFPSEHFVATPEALVEAAAASAEFLGFLRELEMRARYL